MTENRVAKQSSHNYSCGVLFQNNTYSYDGNGNPTYYDEFKSFRAMNWDEENRLLGINDNGRLHFYTYDHKGERALKSSGESSKVVINGQTSAIINHTDNYTAYISPYFVVNKGRFTKHYFEGSSRIVSKLGEGTFTQPAQINAGGINFIRQSALMQQARDKYIQSLGVPPGPPTQHGIYATPEYTGQPYPSIDWKEISQNQEPPEGWPRPPKFNPPGDVPGPPIQFGEPISPDTAQGGFGFIPNGIHEKNIFFYHPDHLGSSSYITGQDGKVSQHTEYIAFGEILFDEHSSEHTMSYLFNGKELDQETGLYYYGARYLDSKTSLWLNVDPLAEKYPNISPYAYVANNPINAIDPDGRWIVFISKNRQQLVYSKGHFYYANIVKDKQGNYNVINTGKRYDGRTDSVSPTLFKLARVYRNIENSRSNILKKQLHTLEKSNKLHIITEGYDNKVTISFILDKNSGKPINEGKRNSDSNHTKTTFNFSKDSKKSFYKIEGVINTDETTVVHEMRHQYDYEIGNMSDNLNNNSHIDPSEIRAVHNENIWRKEKELPLRTKYGRPIDPKLLNNPPNNKNPE